MAHALDNDDGRVVPSPVFLGGIRHGRQRQSAQRRGVGGGAHERRPGQGVGHHAAGSHPGDQGDRLSPEIMGLGPVEASKRLMARLGVTIDDIDLVELNEAFAAQVVPVVRELADPACVNPFGGAIAWATPSGPPVPGWWER